MNDGDAFDPRAITRPDPALLAYYLLLSLLTLVAFPIVFLTHWVKYRTLRYKFDDEGIAMSWGFLFRAEVYLTYRRIQDIHVTRNLLQRWLGLASVAVQTAGGAGVEVTILGIREPDRLRDFLYSKMRGAHGDEDRGRSSQASRTQATPQSADEATELLREIRDSLRGFNERLRAPGERT
jgi:putative membrane protein